MRHPNLPDARQRIQAAQIQGEVQRLTFGRNQPDRVELAVARLHEITKDPVVIGYVLGSYLAYRDRDDWYQPAIDLLRAAGANEEQAALKAEWLRQEIAAGRHLF